MSTVLVVAPIVIGSWPAITAAVTAAVGSLGFAMLSETGTALRQGEANREEIEVKDSEILADAAGSDEQIVVERAGVRAVFSRDGRGGLKLCLEGGHLTKRQLRELGEELLGRVKQQYAYHRIMSELKERNMTVVDEEVDVEQTVKIRVRNW